MCTRSVILPAASWLVGLQAFLVPSCSSLYRLFSSKEIRCNFRKAADPRLISEVRLHHAEIHRKARQRTRGGRVFALVALHQRKVPTLKRFMRSARH